ncbi:MAG: fatty acid desaturase [Alphaproteobacteria bacterium]|nr:fatty acid desaturase [Alphaproteobacteria bacterium]
MPQGWQRSVEWPTILLIAIVYLVIAGIVYFHQHLPWWVMMPVGAYCVALYASLQHEILHGHPTSNRVINESLLFPTLHFWLPFGRYKTTHLQHHNDPDLTDPSRDPESYYMLPEHWAALPGIKRSLYDFNNTLFGRMLIGPAVSGARFWSSDFRAMSSGNKEIRRDWTWFALSALISVCFIWGVGGMPMWQYLAFIAYPGVSLALVRSFCEHRAAENHEHRTIIVEASPFWSLLFLYNNLHVAHHTRPGLAWYKIPAFYRAERDRLIAKNDGYTMNGYGEIFRRYFFKTKEPVPYPNMAWLRSGID